MERFDLDTLEFQAVRALLLARLRTPLGQRAVQDSGPLANAEDARRALAEAGELAQRLAAESAPPLAGAVEVRSWLAPFFRGEHSPDVRDVADLKRVLRAGERCRRWLLAEPALPALVAFGQRFPDLNDLVEELEAIVDDRGEVLSSASSKLAEIRRQIEAAEAAVQAAVARFLADESNRRYLQRPEPSWRHGRPVVLVRQEHRERVAGVLHDRSQSGATLFVEPAPVVEAANALSDARAAEHREIQVVLAHVCRGLGRNREAVERSIETVAQLDLTLARARLVHEDGFCVPEVADGGPLRLIGARHPILLQRDGDQVVPLDLALGEPHHVLVITGPNTGGKTVVLKTVGLLACMAAAGVPVPARAGTRLPWFDAIFADIGDEQAISQNLSTFSSHVRRIARCLELATESSLVLLDELGAGTDPEEGSALGLAVLEHLEQRCVRAVVTTHLGRLKEFAFRHAGAENGSMAFDGASMRPLYRLEVGIPGSSHALDIAGQVGMPAKVVQRARALIGRRDTTVEEVVQQVQATRRQAEEDRRRTAALVREVERNDRALKERLQETERQRLWLEEEADAHLDEQLRAVRRLIDDAWKELQNAPKPWSDTARALRTAVDQALAGSSVHRRRMRFLGGLGKDAVVWVQRLGRRAVVKKVDRVREMCTVEVGKMKVDVPFDDVSWIQPLDA